MFHPYPVLVFLNFFFLAHSEPISDLHSSTSFLSYLRQQVYRFPAPRDQSHATMSTNQNITVTPSKNVQEFLQRHPEVRVGPEAEKALEKIHDTGMTSCLEVKLFGNTILHQDYDGDSNQRVFAFATVDDAEALKRYDEMNGDECAEDVDCQCKAGKEEGPDHYLHEAQIEAKKADCKVHTGDDAPNPDCSACWPIWCGSNCRL